MKFVVQEMIEAPRAIAFAAASDVRGWPAMISGIEATELLTREPVGAGTRFRETRRMFGRPASEVMTLAEFEPPERFVLTAFNHGARYRIEHRFEDMNPGTRLTLTFSARPVTRAARLLAPFAFFSQPALARQIRRDLNDLKGAIERRGADAAA